MTKRRSELWKPVVKRLLTGKFYSALGPFKKKSSSPRSSSAHLRSKVDQTWASLPRTHTLECSFKKRQNKTRRFFTALTASSWAQCVNSTRSRSHTLSHQEEDDGDGDTSQLRLVDCWRVPFSQRGWVWAPARRITVPPPSCVTWEASLTTLEFWRVWRVNCLWFM